VLSRTLLLTFSLATAPAHRASSLERFRGAFYLGEYGHSRSTSRPFWSVVGAGLFFVALFFFFRYFGRDIFRRSRESQPYYFSPGLRDSPRLRECFRSPRVHPQPSPLFGLPPATPPSSVSSTFLRHRSLPSRSPNRFSPPFDIAPSDFPRSTPSSARPHSLGVYELEEELPPSVSTPQGPPLQNRNRSS